MSHNSTFSNSTILLRALACAFASVPWARSERVSQKEYQTSTRAVPVGPSGQRS
ncbi:hypothetical protein [Haladaptatus sp. DFWS20]|uniref:hypothetical protein n=1 Tax=Haladaptatus sp. DFWS20 TaxID=3403467 RepID=UPI003EB9C6B0